MRHWIVGLQTLMRPLSQNLRRSYSTWWWGRKCRKRQLHPTSQRSMYLGLRCHIVFNNESWLENTNSIPLTPTNTTIHGISGNVKASMQTIFENSPILICPDMTDNVLSQGRLAQIKSIMTTFNSIDNIYRIAFGNTTFRISMARDSLYYLSEE